MGSALLREFLAAVLARYVLRGVFALPGSRRHKIMTPPGRKNLLFVPGRGIDAPLRRALAVARGCRRGLIARGWTEIAPQLFAKATYFAAQAHSFCAEPATAKTAQNDGFCDAVGA